MILRNCLLLISDLCGLGVPSTRLRTCFAGRYSELQLWLCRTRTLAMVMNRINYQQRETLHYKTLGEPS